jgi:peptidoglycan/LPS O-acetylase OafA/YrhL
VKRLVWLDVTKALAIWFVVYFHFFRTYFEHGDLPPADWSSFAAGLTTFLREAWLELSGLGFHAVGAFIALSGWALMQSTMRRAESGGGISWLEWYRARFIRLYPMYWVAHLVYLVSPFTARFEQIDHRIILSLLGLRFIDIESNFFYLNAAWWYFAMLIQFYLVFPLLFFAARKLGATGFLIAACALGFFIRYLFLIPFPQNGMWIQGGLALCRLPEFGFGMALAMWDRKWPEGVQRFLTGGLGLVTGAILYPAALQLYANGFTYIFVDFATGACCMLVLVGIAGIISRFSLLGSFFGTIGVYSYGIYLVHHPYVIWLGLRIREQPIWGFLLICIPVLLVLSAWGMLLEKSTNQLVDRLVRKKA